jgi:hypothetical protein
MRVCYLVQGSRKKLEALRFPADAAVYALCYDTRFDLSGARTTLFNAECTWAEGRNLLLDLAMGVEPHFDYLIFCDDDVEFVTGSFEHFEARIAQTRPLAAIPVMPKARVTDWVLPDLDVQTAVAVDEQMVALHRSVVGLRGLAPLEPAHDAISWYVACLLFEYNALSALGAGFHQYNDVEIINTSHTWLAGDTLYRQGDAGQFLPLVKALLEDGQNYDPDLLGIFYPQLAPADFNADAVRSRRRDQAGQVASLPARAPL